MKCTSKTFECLLHFFQYFRAPTVKAVGPIFALNRFCARKCLLGVLTLTLIQPLSNWTHWATLRRHPCLSRAATSASSQVNPIFRSSLLATPLQFALGRPACPLLHPGTCQYSACCGMRWWSIRKTCPSQRSRLSLSMLSMVCCPVPALASTVILSFHEMPSILLCHL